MAPPTTPRDSIAGKLRCFDCGAKLPVGVLARLDPEGAGGDELHALAPRSYSLGRAPECEIQVTAHGSVSRRHALLGWKEGRFEITDEGSSHGTYVNGRRLERGAAHALADGDRIHLGQLERVYRAVWVGAPGRSDAYSERYLRLVREMSSLDPAQVVPRALELLRFVSRVERSYLVGAGVDPSLEKWLTPLDDPTLQVSRSSIEAALRSGEKVHRIWAAGDPGAATAAWTRPSCCRRAGAPRMRPRHGKIPAGGVE